MVICYLWTAFSPSVSKESVSATSLDDIFSTYAWWAAAILSEHGCLHFTYACLRICHLFFTGFLLWSMVVYPKKLLQTARLADFQCPTFDDPVAV